MGLSKAVVKNRVLILMIALILLVPAVFGMLGTRINYDMLDYLPSDMDTVIGQETLKEDFGKGAFSFIVVQDMPVQEVAQLKEKIQQVDHVESVLWYDWRTSPSPWSCCRISCITSSIPMTPPCWRCSSTPPPRRT